MIEKYIVETERLGLRNWKYDDLEDFYEYAKVDGVGQLAGWNPHKDKSESKEILDIFMKNKNEFAIVLKAKNKVIGSIGLRDEKEPLKEDINKNNKNLGFVLSKDFWGMAYMPEAASALINYFFKNENIENIYAGYFLRNTQSKRVQEKLGFRKIATKDFAASTGIIERTIVNRLTKEEWNKNLNI